MREQHAGTLHPPLRGDGRGAFRVWIVGNCGSGKSTLARALAAALGVPCVSLDALFWRPGWRTAPHAAFRQSVQAALDAAPPAGWVVDGNYERRLGALVSARATDIVWLDPPLALYLPRLCVRTLARLLRLAPPCSPGCPERWTEVFCSRESIVWWCLTHHASVRRREQARFRTEGLHVGGPMRRLGGWGGELEQWKRAVDDMLRAV